MLRLDVLRLDVLRLDVLRLDVLRLVTVLDVLRLDAVLDTVLDTVLVTVLDAVLVTVLGCAEARCAEARCAQASTQTLLLTDTSPPAYSTPAPVSAKDAQTTETCFAEVFPVLGYRCRQRWVRSGRQYPRGVLPTEPVCSSLFSHPVPRQE